MTLKNEIFEGIATYKALNNPQDKYANEMYKKRRRENQRDDEVDRGGQTEIDKENARRAAAGGTAPQVSAPGLTIRAGSAPTPLQPMGMQPPVQQTAMQTASPFPQYPQLPGTYRRGGRVQRFANGGSAASPESAAAYERRFGLEDPDGLDQGEADRIVLEMLRPGRELTNKFISADIGEPNEANDPSIELRERGDKDRAALLTLPPSSPDDLPPLPQTPAAARGAARKRGQLPKAGSTTDPQPAATREQLEATFQSPVPEAQPTGADTNDAYLSTDNAKQPPPADSDDAYLTDTAREPPDAERDYRRQFPVPGQDQPISDEEVQAIKTTTPVPATSRYRDWANRGVDEDAASARATREDWNQRMRERRQTRGKASAERQQAEPGLFENLTPQQAQERRAKAEAADRVASSTAPPDIVYPQKEAELRALDTKPPTPEPTQPTQNLPAAKPGEPAQPGEPAKPNIIERLVQQARDRQIRRQGGTPSAPAAPAAPAPQGAVPGQSVVRARGVKRDQPLAAPAPVQPARPPAPVVPGPGNTVVAGSTNGPATPATPAQGGGQGTAQAPPPGAATAQAPSTAPSTTGGGTQVAANVPAAIKTGAPPAARGSLGDQTRTAAFDPTGQTVASDPSDPRNMGAVDQSGRDLRGTGVSQADLHQTVVGAMQSAPKDGHIVGNGAVERSTYQQFVQAHNQGGRLTSGQALLVGMVGKYKVLLSQGRAQEASMMAWGLIQAANIEAASYAKVAQDQMRSGDTRGATQSLAQSADNLPDGMHHRASADGRFIETYDQNGQLVNRLEMNGRAALQLALGLADGSMMWDALQGTVSAYSAMTKPDRNATGRALDNEYKRRQIENADLRNAKLRAGSGPGRGAAVPSEAASRVDAKLGVRPPAASPSRSQGGGEDNGLPDLDRVREEE